MTRTVALAGIVALALARFDAADVDQRRPIDLEASDCSSTSHMFGDYDVARATRHTTIPVGAGPLEIRPGGNGGVRVERGSGGVYGVTACIGAGAPTRGEAQVAADSVTLDVTSGRLRVVGPTAPAARTWSAELIVTAPEGASIDVETSNGPIGIEDVAGTVTAHASNGPISVHGGRGEFDVQTSNGPIDIHLEGRRWDGHLTARASNGPLSVSLPADFESGVEVRSSMHSPWNCGASACGAGSRDWDERHRSLRLGSGPVVVEVSTVNGPVTVTSR